LITFIVLLSKVGVCVSHLVCSWFPSTGCSLWDIIFIDTEDWCNWDCCVELSRVFIGCRCEFQGVTTLPSACTSKDQVCSCDCSGWWRWWVCISPMASVLTDPKQKAVYMAPVSKQPRHKTRPNMPRFQTWGKMWKITRAESPYCTGAYMSVIIDEF